MKEKGCAFIAVWEKSRKSVFFAAQKKKLMKMCAILLTDNIKLSNGNENENEGKFRFPNSFSKDFPFHSMTFQWNIEEENFILLFPLVKPFKC